MRLKGKVLPIALAVMMSLGQVPATAYAAEDGGVEVGEQIEVQAEEEETIPDQTETGEESEPEEKGEQEESSEEETEKVSEEETGEVSEGEEEKVSEENAEEISEGEAEAVFEEKTEESSEETTGTEPVAEETFSKKTPKVYQSETDTEVNKESEKSEEAIAEQALQNAEILKIEEIEKDAEAEALKEEQAARDIQLRGAAATYTVTYVNGKTNPSNPTSYKKSSQNIMLSDPSWKGYTFKGWYYDSDYTSRATMIKANTTGNKTFYAKWVANKYKVSFNGNGSTSGSMKDMTCQYAENYNLRKNSYSRKGYDFTGWNTKANGSGKSYTDEAAIQNLNSNNGAVVTLYAQWKAHSYKLVFKGYRADSGSMSSLSCKYGKSYTLPANTFKKRGYTFVGWNTKTDGSGRSFKDGESVKNLTAVDGNTLTLYTQWEKTQYKIVYGLDGGTNNSKNPTSYNLTTNTITLKDASKKGYIFEGWYTDKTYSTRVTTIPKGSVGKKSLYAKWSLRKYNISYTFNGGNMSDYATYPRNYYITSANIVLPTPNRIGYKFAGWYKNSDFTGARVDSIPSGSYGNVYLYAKWIPITYTVVFNGNGADSGYIGSMTCTYGQKYNFPTNNFTKSGKKFWGWSLEPKDGSDCINNGFSNLTTKDGGVVTLYAQWASVINIVRTESYPIIKGYYNSDDVVVTGLAIDNITYDYIQNSNGTYNVTIHVSYKKIFNDDRFSATSPVGARYYIYDDSEFVIKSGSIYRSGLTVGQSYTDDIKLNGVEEGDIYIDFYDY